MQLKPKKSLGQNFLHDKNIIDKIIHASNINSNDEILEVGPGTGSLTELNVDGTVDNYLYMSSLRDVYRENETPKFRVGGRQRYQTKSASTIKSLSSTSLNEKFIK